MGVAGVGGALAGLSSIPIALSIVSLVNHSGVNFELDGSTRAVRANKIRGALFVGGLVMLGVGLNLRGCDVSGWNLNDPKRLLTWLLLVGAALAGSAFVVMTPRTMAEERSASNHKYSVATIRIARASGARWLALLGGGVIAACIAILLAVA
jgi:hypothetical protein